MDTFVVWSGTKGTPHVRTMIFRGRNAKLRAYAYAACFHRDSECGIAWTRVTAHNWTTN